MTKKKPKRATNSKPVPHIPLPFKEVMADVLKVKPPKKKRGHRIVKPRTKNPDGGARSLAPRDSQESLKAAIGNQ